MLTVLLVAFALLIFHCIFNNRYGYFRDEFNYLSSGNHLAWGYVDEPPLLPFLVRLSRTILGDSLRSKTETAQINEALCKVLCHNLCCVIQSMYELEIKPEFWVEAA